MTDALQGVMAGPEMVDRAVYTSAEIFALERSRIFRRAWLFVAHASEFAKAGDYRASTLAGQPVLAIMGKDGIVRAFFNSCRHKATMIVDDGPGSCDRLKCPYHHWTYDTSGRLVSVPRHEAYGAQFDFGDYGLTPLPRFEQHMGMYFASLDPGAEPLEQFLGAAIPYLDQVAQYDGEDLEAVGTYDYEYEGNWKLMMENTLDDYHAEYLHDHAFAQRANLFEMTGTSGFQETAGSRWSVELGIHGAYDQYDDVRTLVIQRDRPRRVYVGIFPSFIALYHPLWDVTGLRIMNPVAIDRTVVTSYCLVPKSASAEKRQQIAERFHYSWGPGGRAGVDDILVFTQDSARPGCRWRRPRPDQSGHASARAGRWPCGRPRRARFLGGMAAVHARRRRRTRTHRFRSASLRMSARNAAGPLRELVEDYISTLDNREFDAWLDLYGEDGYYAVLRRVEQDAQNNLVLVGEDMKRLRARVQSGARRDLRRTVHTIGWVRGLSEASGNAGFALWIDGVPAYAGEYRFEVATTPAGMRLRKCTVIIDNAMIRQPIFVPI